MRVMGISSHVSLELILIIIGTLIFQYKVGPFAISKCTGESSSHYVIVA